MNRLFGLAVPLFLLGAPVFAQEPENAPPSAAAEPAPLKPKPRPKPKPKPAPKAEAPPEPKAEPAAQAPDTDQPPAAQPPPAADPSAASEPPAKEAPPASPSQGAFAVPPVACDPGKSVLYDGPKETSLWVTRTGTVTIDNPLRPLTPDATRVLQIVIGGKLATVYGPDLNALRRGASPGALEAALGGPIRWDKTLGTVPDTLNIVADSGATIVELRFKACGDAPAAKAAPVAKARKDDKAKQAGKAPAEDGAALAPNAGGSPSAGAAPPRRALPQGAIPE